MRREKREERREKRGGGWQVADGRWQVTGGKVAKWHGGRVALFINRYLLITNHFSLFTFYFLLITLFLVGTTSCASTPPVVKVALVGPFEGAERVVGYDAIYSARLAVRELNEAGGVGGYRVALVALDDGGDPQLAQETAVAVINDPDIVAVLGHWLPETTAVAQPLYDEAGLLFIPLGEGPFGTVPPEALPISFTTAYSEVTPFDEVAGPYAGATYDAFQLLWLGLETAVSQQNPLTRHSVREGASNLSYQGMGGGELRVP